MMGYGNEVGLENGGRRPLNAEQGCCAEPLAHTQPELTPCCVALHRTHRLCWSSRTREFYGSRASALLCYELMCRGCP